MALEAKATSPEVIAKARALGAAAFVSGAKRVPHFNKALPELYRQGDTIAILTAWLAAWDEANLAVPIPGVTVCGCCGSDELVGTSNGGVYCAECGDDCPGCRERGRREESARA